MESWDRSKESSDKFRDLVAHQGDKFVFNRKTNYLHAASCPHYKFRETEIDQILFAPHLVFADREDLHTWINNEGRNRYRECPDCHPLSVRSV